MAKPTKTISLPRARLAVLLSPFLALTASGRGIAAVFEYAMPITTSKGEREAFLWGLRRPRIFVASCSGE